LGKQFKSLKQRYKWVSEMMEHFWKTKNESLWFWKFWKPVRKLWSSITFDSVSYDDKKYTNRFDVWLRVFCATLHSFLTTIDFSKIKFSNRNELVSKQTPHPLKQKGKNFKPETISTWLQWHKHSLKVMQPHTPSLVSGHLG
jgi:hypothetical protein